MGTYKKSTFSPIQPYVTEMMTEKGRAERGGGLGGEEE